MLHATTRTRRVQTSSKTLIEKSRKCHKKGQNSTCAREAHRPALSSPSAVIKMLKGLKKHENKEQGKIKHAPGP